jgi:rSAM/selenodomain-associated transferase 2
VHPAISIIIPTRNEAGNLPRSLASIEAPSLHTEIVVVDAASDDDTTTIAKTARCRIIESPLASRPLQLNIGAKASIAPILLFLHADTRLPAHGLEQIATLLADNPKLVGGAFDRQFDSPSLFLKATCTLAGLRSRCWGLFLGDQAIFVRRQIFEKLGGFNESLNQCEDLDFSRRLRTLGPTAVIRPPVISSARRFEKHGPVKTTLHDFKIARTFLRSHPPALPYRAN